MAWSKLGNVFTWSVAEYRQALQGLVVDAIGCGTEAVALDRHAVGRRLAADVVAADDLPRFDNSAMDGYAVGALSEFPSRSGDSSEQQASSDAAGLALPVVADVPAGEFWDGRLGMGEAARVMTGARVPDGTLAVVPVELTDASPTGPAPEVVRLLPESVNPGRHIRLAGEDVRAGQVIARHGALATAALIALGRSAGVTQIDVAVPVTVAVIATGAELANAGTDPGRGGIHESNSDMIAAQASAAGCRVVSVEVCDDEPEHLQAVLDGLEDVGGIDLVITTGGVSMGAHEVIRQVLEPTPDMRFGHVEMQPGAPQGHGRYRDLAVVCLPGTPVGAFVGFEMLLRPALDAAHHTPARAAHLARWRGPDRRAREGRVQFVTAVAHSDGTVAAANSRHLAALAEATCLIEVPASVTMIREGDEVLVHPL